MTTPAASESESGRPRRDAGGGWRFLRDVLIILVAAVVIAFLIETFLVRSFYIPSASMEHTLDLNDRVVVNELQPKVFGLERGDVVVFQDPGGWLPATHPDGNPLDGVLSVFGLTDSDDHLIKRVIGLPGDHVTCCNSFGQMSVDGTPIDEPYTLLDGNVAASGTPFDVHVPKGDIWVMGDNRYDSLDSRAHVTGPTHGFVPLADVTGRAVLISWPIGRWTWLGDYPLSFAGVGTK